MLSNPDIDIDVQLPARSEEAEPIVVTSFTEFEEQNKVVFL